MLSVARSVQRAFKPHTTCSANYRSLALLSPHVHTQYHRRYLGSTSSVEGRSDVTPGVSVSTAWLAEALTAPASERVQVLDGSWYVPGFGNELSPIDEYHKRHIPGAVFFDLDAASDTSSPNPHMLPSKEHLGAYLDSINVTPARPIVFYDVYGLISAARGWYTLRMMGLEDVYVLRGNLGQWEKEGRPVVGGAETLPTPNRPAVSYMSDPDVTLIRDKNDMVTNVTTQQFNVFDARSAARFNAEAAEPRPGSRVGHIPHSHSLPYASLVDPSTGALLPPAQLGEVIQAAGLDVGTVRQTRQPRATMPTTSCGSGTSAAVIHLALAELGVPLNHMAMYDASWAEYGMDPDTPIEPNNGEMAQG